MTSNIGTKALTREAALGFQSQGEDKKASKNRYESMRKDIMADLSEHFRPEFLNRIDKVIIFNPLSKKDIRQIVSLELNKLVSRVKKHNHLILKIDDSIMEAVAKKGYDPKLGARPVRRVIAELVEDKLSEALLQGAIKQGQKVKVSFRNKKVVLG